MKKAKSKIVDKSRVLTFISENKMFIAALGGIITGITLTGLLGSERAKQVLGTVASKLVDFNSYKELLSPLFAKNPVQGL